MKIGLLKFSPIFCSKLGEDQKKGSSLKFSPSFCPKLGEDQDKNKSSSLKFSPSFCPSLGEDQKQTSSSTKNKRLRLRHDPMPPLNTPLVLTKFYFLGCYNFQNCINF